MSKTILVVDDESSVRYTVKMGLEQIDKEITVKAATGGAECLQLLKAGPLPDLILLDIMMPEMTGWQTFNNIKDNLAWRKIPIVFLTARTDQVAKKAGTFLADDYIGKPFTIPELKQRIDKLLKK